MDITRAQERFREIGVKLTSTEIPERSDYHYYYEPPEPYTLSMVRDRRGRVSYVLGVMLKVRDELTVEVHTVDKKAQQLVLGIRVFDELRQFLCGNNNGRWDVAEIPGGPAGIRRAAKELNEMQRERENQQELILHDQTRERAKRQRTPPALSFDEVLRWVTMNAKDYAFYLELIESCKRLKLNKGKRFAISQYGDVHTNTFQFALMRVASFRKSTIGGLEDWRPKSKNAHKQFNSLVRHLFAMYPIPSFMDSVWFRAEAQWVSWFIHIGRGENIRTVENFPLEYTKKMAFMMLESPGDFTVEQAIRWGQVSALGGDKRFLREIDSTRITQVDSTAHDGYIRHRFWRTVIDWFLLHPMLDRMHYGPIVDFVAHKRFGEDPDADREFEITGRSPHAMLRLVEEWHGELGRAPSKNNVSWAGQGLDWNWSQKTRDEVNHIWEMKEIRDSDSLAEEGRRMRHCVSTYASSCVEGRSAILSLVCDGRRALTIEYLPGLQRMGEIRGNCNRLPKAGELNVLKRWANDKGLEKAWVLRS